MVGLARRWLNGGGGCWRGRRRGQLDLWHHGCGRTGFCLFVGAAVDDVDALQIFLDDFLAHHFNVLFGFSPGSFAKPVRGMFLHQYPYLFSDVGASGQFGYALTDQFSLVEIALSMAGEKMGGVIAGCRRLFRSNAWLLAVPLLSLVKQLEGLIGVVAHLRYGEIRR